MSSGALFGGTTGRSQSKNLVEFRAGKMTMKGRTVHPDKRKGTVYIYQSDDSLMHFCWRERSKSTAEDDLIIFPDDVEYKHVAQCTTGRVYLLKFKSNSRKMFFWMQEPKADKDEENCRKLNEYLNNPPAPGSTRSASGGVGSLPSELSSLGGDSDLQSLLSNMNQQQLMQLLGGMGGMSGLSSLMSARSTSSLSDSSPPSRIQSTPGSRSGTTVDAVQPGTRPVTAATLSPQSTSQAGNQRSSSQTGTGAQDTPVPAVPPRIQLSDLQNILSRLEPMDTDMSTEADLSTAITSEAMIPVLANADVQQRLIPLLPEAAELPKTEAELRETMHSPQFHQALHSFSSALASGQLGPLMRQFGLDDSAVAAAQNGDVLAFAKAMQDALAKKSDAGSGEDSKPADEDRDTSE